MTDSLGPWWTSKSGTVYIMSVPIDRRGLCFLYRLPLRHSHLFAFDGLQVFNPISL